MSDGNRHSTKLTFPIALVALWGMLLIPFLITGCTVSKPTLTQAPLVLSSVFPAANAIPGWEISQIVTTYSHDDLFNLVDGQADSFFVYGFQQVAVQRYQNSTGIVLNVEIWQVATPADAYGLFSAGRGGSPASIGNQADSDPGRRLAFWQERYFINLDAAQPIPDENLQAFARFIAGKLPKGGATPLIVGRLPQSGLVEQSVIFFQMEVWLGGANILGLSQATNGVVGQYKLGNVTATLMLVEYPTSDQAANACKALQNGSLSDLVTSDAQAGLLRAVFGKVDSAQAQTLLQAALK